jgi:CBS domain-containing protein
LCLSNVEEEKKPNGGPTSTIASFLTSTVGAISNSDIITLEANDTVDDASRLMKEKNSTSVLVSARGDIVGVVSKTDILFKVMSQNRDPAKVRLREIMSSPVLTIRPNATVEDALSKMAKRNVRQIFLHAYNAIIGVVSREQIYRRMEEISLLTEDLAIRGTPVCIVNSKTVTYLKDKSRVNYSCPYCQSPFDTTEGLSKHMDRFHNDFDAGVLEGDVRSIFE